MSFSKEDEAKVRATIPLSSSSCYSFWGLGLGLVLVLVLYCDVEAANALRLAPPRHRPSWHGGELALSGPSQEDSTHHHRGIVLPQPPQPQPSPFPPVAQPPSAPSFSPPRLTPTPTPPSSNTSSSSSNCSKMKPMTQGPYWVEEDLQTSDIRQDLPFGVRLDLIFKVANISTTTSSSPSSLGSENNNNVSCKAVENARIDVWHARYDGKYSDVEKDHTQGETWLRGYQFTNSSGYASFTTIYPGWYITRTTHIHVRVRTYDSDGNTTLYEDTSQIFFNDIISEEVFNNVYPYNARSRKRDTYNSDDLLFTISNVVPLVGNYTDGYTSSTVELNIPFSTSPPYYNAFIRRVSDDDDFDQHHI